MKKKLLAVATAIFCIGQADAQLQDTTLAEVQITASRTPATFYQSTQTVEVITAEQIRQMPVASIQEVLQYTAGVDIRSRGPMGVQSDISIRGGTFDQVLIMIDGVKISDPQTGHHNFNLPINLFDIERIEILKGAGARAFGQNAFSGAINIITKKPEKSQLAVQSSYGQHNFMNAAAAGTLVKDNVTQRLSASYTGSDGYRMNTDFDNLNAYYSAGVDAGKARMSFNVGANQRSFGANGFYTDRFPWQWEQTQTLFFSSSLNMDGKNNFGAQAYMRRHYDEFLLKRDTPSFYKNNHTTDIAGLSFHYSIPSKAGVTAIGAEIRNEAISSNSLGRNERQNAGFTVEHMFSLNRLRIVPGVNVNWTNVARFQFFPGINVGYQLTKSTNLYASANKSFRLPTFTDLYYKDPANQGNPNLLPESAWTYEAGARYIRKAWSGYVSIFNRNGENMIDWVHLNTPLVWNATNLQSIQTYGAEVKAAYAPFLYKPEGFLRRVEIQYAYIESSSTEDKLESKYVFDHLTHQLIFGLNHKIYKNLSHNLQVRYEDRTIYEPYVLLDSRIAWDAKKYTIFVQGSNLLDVEYFEIGKVPMPGRWVIGGVSVRIGG